MLPHSCRSIETQRGRGQWKTYEVVSTIVYTTACQHQKFDDSIVKYHSTPHRAQIAPQNGSFGLSIDLSSAWQYYNRINCPSFVVTSELEGRRERFIIKLLGADRRTVWRRSIITSLRFPRQVLPIGLSHSCENFGAPWTQVWDGGLGQPWIIRNSRLVRFGFCDNGNTRRVIRVVIIERGQFHARLSWRS